MNDEELLRRAREEYDRIIGRKRSVSEEIKETKPGYKTTEFWLSAVATFISLAFASGIISDGSQADKVIGFISAALSSLGYSVSRGIAKK